MVADVAAGTAFLEIVGGYGGKVQGVIQFSECQQSGVGGDGGNADEDSLEKAVNACVSERNDQAATINWRFSANDARTKLRRLYRCHG